MPPRNPPFAHHGRQKWLVPSMQNLQNALCVLKYEGLELSSIQKPAMFRNWVWNHETYSALFRSSWHLEGWGGTQAVQRCVCPVCVLFAWQCVSCACPVVLAVCPVRVLCVTVCVDMFQVEWTCHWFLCVTCMCPVCDSVCPDVCVELASGFDLTQLFWNTCSKTIISRCNGSRRSVRTTHFRPWTQWLSWWNQ